MKYEGIINLDRILNFIQAQELLPYIKEIAKIDRTGKAIIIKGEFIDITEEIKQLTQKILSLGIKITGLITIYDDKTKLYDLILIKNYIKKHNGKTMVTILP